jgi:sporulation-control protein
MGEVRMLLRKYMTLLGIGSARVDLVLEKDFVKVGESIIGYFSISGGTIEQQIKRIECDLVKVNVQEETEEIVDTTTILSASFIESEDHKKIPFSFYIQPGIEPSSSMINYRFKTRMIFQEGVKSLDQDIITVLP